MVSQPPLPPDPAAPEVPPEGPACPRCGAPHDLYQEYCLECGARLPGAQIPAAFMRTELWSRDSPAWLWAALLALFLVALVAGAIAAVAATKDDEKGRVVLSTGVGTTATVGTIDPGTETIGSTASIETITSPTTQTVATLDTSTLTTATTSTTTTTTQSGNIRSWPSGREGYTVVLASVETSKGRDDAEQKANQAIANGLTDVGILNSSDFLTLNPGYYVVFKGVYDTAATAQSGLATARSSGFPLAYVREVSP
ncbi:MAG TPA: hypothetical protein VES61_00240 [Gaiellaceae bacterium]|nr:hypothetical protein [Gaiellaceae bacterium]